jgi:hypothetical protein
MATSLTFTSDSFLNATIASTASNSSNNVKFDILAADATYSRRIYGISVTSTDSVGAQTVKFHLNDGTTSYQLYTLNIPLNSGNLTTAASVDAFGSVYGSSVFQKQRDANGVPYFNIPATWKLQMEYGTALTLTRTLVTFVFGETYA